MDITIFKSIIEGVKDDKKIRYTINLYDKYCPESDTNSMARTTGYTATVALRMIAEGIYKHKGISPPEFMGKHPECIAYMQKGLREKNVFWRLTKDVLE